MADYKPHQYASKTLDYNTRVPAKQLDTRVKFYEPSRPIKDIPSTKTYDTRPPRQLTARTYDKVRTYDSYTEYVPPWSRGKEKAKREKHEKPAKAIPSKKKVEPEKVSESSPPREPSKVTFAPLPPVAEKEPSLQALGSVKRMLDLFYL